MEKFITVLPLVLLTGCVAKISLFFLLKSKRDNLLFILYYPHPIIILTENNEQRKMKQVQNTLSKIILAVFVLYGALFFLVEQSNL